MTLISMHPKTLTAHQKSKRPDVEVFRVKAWFNSVAFHSGKTAYRLELEFAKAGRIVKFSDGSVSRPSLWDKYARGEVTPGRDPLGAAPKQPNLVDQVEGRYPNTAYWLRHPFWVALQLPGMRFSQPATPDVLSKLMHQLPETVTELLFRGPPPEGVSPFKRREVSFAHLDRLSDIATLDGAAALILLLQEALLFQDRERFTQVLNELHHYDSWFSSWPETSAFYQELLNFIDQRFGRFILPGNDGKWYRSQRDWRLHQATWWSAPSRAVPQDSKEAG